jgi:primary-amine oxidase
MSECNIGSGESKADFVRLCRIAAASIVVQQYVATQTPIKAFKFASSLLINPPKAAVLMALGLPMPKDTSDQDRLPLRKRLAERHAECQIFDAVTGFAYEVVVVLTPLSQSSGVASHAASNLGKVTQFKQLPVGMQPGLAPEEVSDAEDIMRSDPRVIEAARQVGVEPDQLYADGWSIGYDDRFPTSMRLQQCLVYARKSPHENLYAHPMDFYVVLDSNEKKVLSIDFPKHRGPVGSDDPDGRPGPVSMDVQEGLAHAERERIPPPMQSFDYLPDLMKEDSSMPALRQDLKPLHITQPEGVSYTLRGNEISWQKWNFHVGFHPRDGLVISTVTYNDAGEIRPLFYRMSVAEMVVPYGETIHPHPRKFAFDVGEYGMGTLSNSLELGCDCLGSISYLDGTYVGIEGKPVTIKQCICIHEEDAGVSHKHTDFVSLLVVCF